MTWIALGVAKLSRRDAGGPWIPPRPERIETLLSSFGTAAACLEILLGCAFFCHSARIASSVSLAGTVILGGAALALRSGGLSGLTCGCAGDWVVSPLGHAFLVLGLALLSAEVHVRQSGVNPRQPRLPATNRGSTSFPP